jgi:glycosyltransferase involved in cell wall biosynthesis
MDRWVQSGDVFHATDHLLPPLRRSQSVFTVHDLIYLFYPQYHLPLNRWYLTLMMPRFLRRADAIIAVSENTRRDVTRMMGIPAEKMTVIHEGVNPAYHAGIAPAEVARVRQKYQLPERYILFLGTLEPRKNIGLLLEAYHALLNRDPSVPRLVVAGRKGWLFEPVFEKVRALGLGEQVCFTDWVPEADTPPLVAGAEVFAYPSLYEGFGLPPLEAMACGTPVITSTASSLPEVVGDGALLVDPHDAAALAQALERVLADAELRGSLRARAIARARLFTWEAAARQTLAVYQQVLQAKPSRRARTV